MTAFRAYARYYDLLYATKEQEAAYVLRIVQRHRPRRERSSILAAGRALTLERSREPDIASLAWIEAKRCSNARENARKEELDRTILARQFVLAVVSRR